MKKKKERKRERVSEKERGRGRERKDVRILVIFLLPGYRWAKDDKTLAEVNVGLPLGLL